MNVLTILWKNVKWRYHNPFTVMITIIQPIIWLVLYSAVAGQNMHGLGIDNYTTFILPGLVVLVIFAACGSSGIMNYMMKADRSFYRILITPVSRNSIILGQILEAVLCTFFEVMIMIIISKVFFSVKIIHSLESTAIIILLIFLTAFFVSSIAYAVSLIIPNEMLYETIMNALVLPLFFLSPALFPVDKIDGILKVIITLNPFTHVINSLRYIFLTGIVQNKEVYISILLLIVLSVLAYIFAKSQLKKEMDL